MNHFPTPMTDQTNPTPAIPNDSESFRTVPNPSEDFGTIPNDAESFRTVRNASERNENHTLTVREVARMFETAGVARTERSIVNWCQPNKSGIARLDAYFDPNERRYYITPQSVDLAIAEEKAKAAKGIPAAEGFGNAPENPSGLGDKATSGEHQEIDGHGGSDTDSARLKDLEQEVMDLKIMNRGKDYFIDQLKQDREAFVSERQQFVEKLITFTRKVGELESELRRLEEPNRRGRGDENSPIQIEPTDSTITPPGLPG